MSQKQHTAAAGRPAPQQTPLAPLPRSDLHTATWMPVLPKGSTGSKQVLAATGGGGGGSHKAPLHLVPSNAAGQAMAAGVGQYKQAVEAGRRKGQFSSSGAAAAAAVAAHNPFGSFGCARPLLFLCAAVVPVCQTFFHI